MAAPRVTRRPTGARVRKAPWAFLHERESGTTCGPGARPHKPSYHRPLLLDTPASAQQLLAWFDATQHDRDMPWRQPWMDPEAPLAKRAPSLGSASTSDVLQKRAYEVWISEIMLQQTRVETVRSYWRAWMEKWPTIEALAEASVDDVLAAWRGLGYYGRARRIHEAAQKVVRELGGRLPEYADALGRDIPGIGPYTAGAISSIVFGHAVPILDGNVARVLSRQTGLYADPRAKSTTDLQWELARLLVESVAPGRPSDVPGRWNQGLMELGSTLCTPTRPDCEACPIRATCRAYAEGARYEASLASPSKAPAACVDVEDLCAQCAPLPEPADDAPSQDKGAKKLTQMTLQGLAAAPSQDKGRRVPMRIRYAQLFPMRVAKQAPRCEVRRVCIVRCSDGPTPKYLLQQRPPEGLLASLWEFPTEVLPDESECDRAAMERGARAFVETLAAPPLHDAPVSLRADAAQYLGTVRHEFSHLHWLMHVVLTDVSLGPPAGEADRAQWLDGPGVEAASMGTGLRRCWALVLIKIPMKFSTIFSIVSVVAVGLAQAAPTERAYETKARIQAENGLEKRGNGKMTWYGGGMLNAPACGGPTPDDNELVVAVAEHGGYGSCNQKVRFHYQGKSVEATIRDYCEGCDYGHFDATKGLFSHFANLDKGVLTGLNYELL
ncbi:hypothetical protein MCAP1_001175 [Malassezia caprae]|uniref:Adenine DNA glycosylase n=1 Tax=Malassezia caprae TaxID=1381934 RepID=A0AAF0EAB5_9BASI|nr:hypothetical protein MCAP1_001175 [Malassezia caprae]